MSVNWLTIIVDIIIIQSKNEMYMYIYVVKMATNWSLVGIL